MSEVLRGLDIGLEDEDGVDVRVGGGGEKVSILRSMRLSLPLRDLASATLYDRLAGGVFPPLGTMRLVLGDDEADTGYVREDREEMISSGREDLKMLPR